MPTLVATDCPVDNPKIHVDMNIKGASRGEDVWAGRAGEKSDLERTNLDVLIAAALEVERQGPSSLRVECTGGRL